MSSKPAFPSPTPSIKEFVESLEDPLKLPELVRRLMDMRKEDATRLLRGSTRTGFRRVHEHVTSAVDRALEVLARGKFDDESFNKIALMFTRGLILVNYQEARDQLNEELASRVKAMITHVLEVLRTKDRGRIYRVLESMRTLMDVLTVLVYRYVW